MIGKKDYIKGTGTSSAMPNLRCKVHDGLVLATEKFNCIFWMFWRGL